MPDKKLTDAEIIKALEECVEFENLEVKGRTYRGDPLCCLFKLALDLINRQKAEIAYWQDEAVNAKREAVKAFADIAKRRLPVISPAVFYGIAREMIGGD